MELDRLVKTFLLICRIPYLQLQQRQLPFLFTKTDLLLELPQMWPQIHIELILICILNLTHFQV